jgi:hypothetical protein
LVLFLAFVAIIVTNTPFFKAQGASTDGEIIVSGYDVIKIFLVVILGSFFLGVVGFFWMIKHMPTVGSVKERGQELKRERAEAEDDYEDYEEEIEEDIQTRAQKARGKEVSKVVVPELSEPSLTQAALCAGCCAPLEEGTFYCGECGMRRS